LQIGRSLDSFLSSSGLLGQAPSQQLALITSKLGLWDSGLSNPQTAELIENTRQILQTTGTTESERKNILAPLYWRMALNYVEAGRRMIDAELIGERDSVNAARRTASGEEVQKLNEKMPEIGDARQRLSGMDLLKMTEERTIQPLQKLVNDVAIC
jgi:hypothetical protein